jgi:hypothetical protein
MCTITLLDLNDDIICDILRRVAATDEGEDATSEDYLPSVGLGTYVAGAKALVAAASTCKRLRLIVCEVLPSRLCVRLRTAESGAIALGARTFRKLLPGRLGSSADRLNVAKDTSRFPFLSTHAVDVGTPQKAPGHHAWMKSDLPLQSRGLGATPAVLSFATCKLLSSLLHVRSLDVVTCKLEPPAGCLGCMVKLTRLTSLAFTLHAGVTDGTLEQLSSLQALESLAIICDTAPRVRVRTRTFKRCSIHCASSIAQQKIAHAVKACTQSQMAHCEPIVPQPSRGQQKRLQPHSPAGSACVCRWRPLPRR